MKDFINNLTTGFGIKDVLDILIVALIVYKVLDFIRETRAQQLVKGLFVLVAAFLVSDALHLYTLNWILRGTMTIGVVALIICFNLNSDVDSSTWVAADLCLINSIG